MIQCRVCRQAIDLHSHLNVTAVLLRNYILHVSVYVHDSNHQLQLEYDPNPSTDALTQCTYINAQVSLATNPAFQSEILSHTNHLMFKAVQTFSWWLLPVISRNDFCMYKYSPNLFSLCSVPGRDPSSQSATAKTSPL